METADRVPETLPLRALIDRLDWGQTAVGEQSGWTQSLRTALSICLSSRFPIVIFWGPELVQLYNDAYISILGARHPTGLGQRARDCWPEIWDAIGPMLAGVLERGEATWSENLLLPVERFGAPEEAYFTFSYSPIADGEGIGGVFCAVAETTATVLREREARERAEVLAQLDRAKTEFFNNVSHEFRTPLTLILGPLDEWLRSGRIDPPELTDDLVLVRRNARRLLRLVTTLLDFNRLEANRLELRPIPIDPAAFTAGIASTFRSAMSAAGLHFDVDTPPVGPVMLDPRLWETIVLNLLANAIKYTLTGGVSLSLTREGNGLQCAVTDTGVGVTTPERVFERFWRADGQSARSYEGSGIGLALVREIAELHGGSTTFDSVPGAGSTVTVTVPFIPADATTISAPKPSLADLYVDEAAVWTNSAAPNARSPRELRPRVLVVDDNADLRSYVARLLDDLYDVTLASDGHDALAKIAASAPHMVVCDVMMPGMDGLTFVGRLRENVETRELPVLLLSARVDDDAAAAAIAAGADGYLTKPFVGSELLVLIERHLHQSRLRREEEARFRAIADHVPHIIYTHAPDRIVEWANARWYEYTQLPPGIATTQAGLALVVAPEDFARFQTDVERAFATGEAYESEIRLKPYAGSDDTYRWHVFRALPMRDASGAISRWAGSGTDVHAHRLAEQAARERLQGEFEREHQSSLAFQTAALPRDLPEIAGIRLDALYVAAEAQALVGGDWYDAFRLPDGRIVLSVGDVMGNGLAAAVTMGGVRQAIRGAAQIHPDPGSILDAVDRVLHSEEPDRIVTAFIGILDPVTETLSYASAGHPPPMMHAADGRVTQLEAGEVALGLGDLSASERPLRVTDVPDGTTIVLYTDGLTEATHDILAGERRLREALERGILHAVGLRDYVAPRVTDDVAILMVTVRQTNRPRWSVDTLNVESTAKLRRDVVERLATAGVRGSALHDAEIILRELLANVERHSGGGPVSVVLDLEHDPVLHILDRGRDFPFHARLPNDPLHESGRGLFIAAKLARELSVTARPGGGNHARVILAR